MEFDIRTILTAIFIALGCFLLLVATLGVIRFPDLYTRMHAASKADTLGQTLILFGLIIYTGFNLNSVKLLIIMVLFFIINPAASHFLAKAAYIQGMKPWTNDSKLKDQKKQREEVK